MKNIIVHFSLVLFILSGINQVVSGQSNSKDLIRISCDFRNTGSINMTNFFSEIRYIPLETNTNCLIGNLNIAVFGKEIIVKSHDSEQNIFRFSNQGEFLNKIGDYGRGPAEYQNNCEVRLIGDTVYVVSMFSNSISCYSLSGEFLKKKPYK